MKTIYKLGMLAVAALAFAGCSKEVDNTAIQNSGTHTLTFTVQKDVDTRTAVVEGNGVASYVWTEGDDQYFHIYENGVEATAITMVLSADKKLATFKATFDNTDATEFSYRATYGSDLASSKPHNPLIPADQKPRLDSFDPAADVLVSAEDIVLDEKADENTEFLFKLKRVVSVNKITLRGLTAGEKISTVELASDMNFSARYGIENGNYSANAKKIVLDYSDLDDAVIGTDGTFPVYFVSAPVDGATFSVRVVTEGTVYLRDDFTSKLTLAVGTYRRIGINLEGYGETVSEGTVYTLVESQDDLYDGATYIIAAKDVNVVMGLYTGGNNHPVVTVNKGTDASGKSTITVDNTLEVEPITIVSNGSTWYMKNAASGNTYEGQYLICGTGSNNRLQETASESSALKEWTIAINEGVASIINANTTAQRTKVFFNNSNSIFACYAPDNTSYKEISLYVDKSTCVELDDPELSFSATSVEVAWDDIKDFVVPTLNNPHSVSVTYSSSNTEVATVDSATGEIEFVGDGTTVITATSAKTTEYKAGSAQYTLVVTGAPVEYDFTTVAELNALASSTEVELTGTLTNAVISFAPDAKNAVIKDATGSVLVYKDGHGYKQGQTFTGELTVKLKKYNNASEITAIDAAFTGTGAVVNPVSVTLADLVGNFATWQNAYVTVEDLEVVSVSGQNVNVKNGDKTYVVYSSDGDATCAPEDIIKVTGTIAQYKNSDQVKAWSADAIEVTQEHQKAKHAITFTQPEEGGSFTVSANGAQISSGTELDEDTVVTLAAIAAEGFSFAGWSVSGATVSGNTETATFTVGTADVTIAAVFVSNDLTTEVISGTFTMVDGSLTLTTSSGITIVQAKGTSSNAPNASYATASTLRIYDGNTITFSGKTITKIEFTHASSYNGGADTSSDVGTYTRGTTSSIWEGESTSVTITNTKASGASNTQLRPTKIVVTYK